MKIALEAKKTGSEVFLLLMLDLTNLARKGAFDQLKPVKPFRGAKEKIMDYVELGGKIFAAKSCVINNEIEQEEINEDVEVIKINKVIDLINTSDKVIHL